MKTNMTAGDGIRILNTMNSVTGWRKLHNEELRGLYSSPSIVRVIRARRMRWAGHVARMGEVRGAYNVTFWLGGLKGGDH
jgi:hypothetical protein